jgi:hypothetical protein
MSNVIFQPPPGLAWSVTKRPKYSTLVQTPISARGQLRIARQQYPIWEYEMVWEYLKGGEQTGITTSSRADNAYQQLLGFFMARQGGFDSFLYSDPNDNSVIDGAVRDGRRVDDRVPASRTIGSGVDIVQNIDASAVAPSIYKYDYQGTKNILQNSAQFGVTPFNIGGSLTIPVPIVTQNAAFAPDGSLTAVKMVFAAAPTSSDYGEISQSVSASGPLTGRPFVTSIWLRADTPTTATLYQVENGTPFNGISATLNITTLWTRFNVPFTFGTSTYSAILFTLRSLGPSQSQKTIYAWGPQIEPGLVPSNYQPTFGSNILGPTLRYATARTNKLIQTQTFASGWSINASTMANGFLAPDGSSTATKLMEDTTTAPHFMRQLITGLTVGLIYTYSIFVQAQTRTNVYVNMNDNVSTNMISITASLQDGSVIYLAGGSGVVTQSIGNGWWRISLTAAVPANGQIAVDVGLAGVGFVNYLGGGTGEYLYVWGAQLETGLVATPYIATTATAVTVGADYSLGSTGIVTFASAPASGAAWTGNYFYRLHFGEDSVDFEEFMYQFWQCQSVKFESVIL